MKNVKQTNLSNKKLVSLFVKAYVNVDTKKLYHLLHDEGNYLGLCKDGGIYVLNSFSTIDNTENMYCRMNIEKCKEDSSFTLCVKILYLDKGQVSDVLNPCFTSKHNPNGGEYLRYFWFSFKDGKIFEVYTNPKK